ncbi:DNA polymerase I [Spirochaeta dissipatitropha]
MNQESLFILDGYSVIYRSYFAFIRSPLRNSRGENTSALFGFARTILQLFQRYSPGYFAVALDSIGPTFRHEQYPPYKQTRDKTPDDLISQIPLIESFLDALGVPQIRVEGYEADDIMASYARLARDCGMNCYVVSGDKDLLQLVAGSVKILKPEKGGLTEMGREEVRDAWGVKPEQILDYLSLVGDSADNIPGVKGIGAKTAAALLADYQDMDDIYANIEKISSKSQRSKLAEDRENAYMSRELVRLVEDMELPLSLEELHVPELRFAAAAGILEDAEVGSIAAELRNRAAAAGNSATGNPVSGESAPVTPAVSETTEAAQTPGSQQQQGDYILVDNIKKLEEQVQAARKAGVCAFDTETDSLDDMTANLVGFSMSSEPGSGCYCPLKGPDGPVLALDAVVETLQPLFDDDSICLVFQNAKYDYKVLQRHGLRIRSIGFDTLPAAWVLDASSNSFGMDALAERYLQYSTSKYSDVVPKNSSFDQVAMENAVQYAAEDADITLRLYTVFRQQLAQRKLEKVYYELELPLIRVLAEMELAGISVDVPYLDALGAELEKRLEQITADIYELVGYEFNINSTQQLQQVLFEERKLKPIKKTKSGYSTDVSVLQELAAEDPVPQHVLQYRQLAKLKSTYVDSLPKLVNPETGRLHTHYHQTGTATGRLSSKDPNLQNIPIREDEGRKIREAFKPADGHVFVSADYSQIELVVLAHLSDDPGLKAAFTSGEDVHRSTGSLIFGVSPDEVSSEQRRIAKTINFGVMYGMSAFRLSRDLGISRKEADHFIQSYFATYPAIQRFIQETVHKAEESGHTTTLMGHERVLPAINSKNKMEKSGAERVAVNTPIQGTAADIVKLAMLRVDQRLQKEGLKSRMLLQVHDELILECPLEEADRIEAILAEEMPAAMELSVPLQVSIERGKSWGDMH